MMDGNMPAAGREGGMIMPSMGSKLGMSFAVLGAICVVTGIVSYHQTQVVRQKMEDVVK